MGEGPWFAGATFSLADLLIAPQLDLFTLAPEWETLSTPALRAYVERAEARPSFQATTWEKTAAMAA